MSMPTHHPGDDLLFDYAGGCLVEPASLVVACHLTLCPGCRRSVTEMEAVGGALLEELAPEPVSAACRESLFARLDEPEEPAPPRPCATARRPAATAAAPGFAALPEPLRRHIGDGGALRWRTMIPGIQAAEVRLAGGTAHLVRMRGGVAVPRHSHEGMELALILDGGFTDAYGHFARGDVAVGDASVDHRPLADADGCLCLSVTLGRLRLTGPLGRLIDPFWRM